MLPALVTLLEVGPRDGRIAEVLYAVGDQVGEGDDLLRMATP